jgi:2,5-furandicarboxylate decarboxylase 1
MTGIYKPMRGKPDFPPAPGPKEGQNIGIDKDLRGWLETNEEVVTIITKPVSVKHIGAIAAQSEGPVVFENVIEKPGFRVVDILVKHRNLQARALGVAEEDYLPTLAYRLRQPPRGVVDVKTGPIKEVILLGDDIDVRKLPICFHSDQDPDPMMTCMNWVKDPITGHYNVMNAMTTITGPREGFSLFVSRDTSKIFETYKQMGETEVPIAFVAGVPPAYEIMGNYAGLHIDSWGEVDMFGTIMDQDVEFVPCETIDLKVPAHAEIVIEGLLQLGETDIYNCGPNPQMYAIPSRVPQPPVKFTAVTMRKDRPIYRTVQTVPETDHQPLPRLCHEAVLYNRLREMGVDVKDVRFPTWGGAMGCILQVNGAPRDGVMQDALMTVMTTPLNNAKIAVAVSDDTDIDDPGAVFHAIATRCDPGIDVLIPPRTRGHPGDPSGTPIPGDPFNRVCGKMAIDATIKSRLNVEDFRRAWPHQWGQHDIKDYLD